MGGCQSKAEVKGQITAELSEAQRCTVLINIGHFIEIAEWWSRFHSFFLFLIIQTNGWSLNCMSEVKALKALIPTECMRVEQNVCVKM